MKQFVGSRQIDNRHDHLVSFAQPDTDGTMLDASTVVGGSVDGVDDPSVGRCYRPLILLFAQKTASGQLLRQPFTQIVLYGQV